MCIVEKEANAVLAHVNRSLACKAYDVIFVLCWVMVRLKISLQFFG